MRHPLLLVLTGFLTAITGCATVDVPETVPIPTDTPVVSEVLEQERSGRFLKRKVDELVKIPLTVRWKEQDSFFVDCEAGALIIR